MKFQPDLDLIADMVRSHEALQTRFFELQDELKTSAELLRETFEAEASLGNGTQIETRDEHNGDLLIARLQDSFTIERRPDAPQRSLDRVFKRTPYRYVKIERVRAVPAKHKTASSGKRKRHKHRS